MKIKVKNFFGAAASVAVLLLTAGVHAAADPKAAEEKIEVSFPAAVHAGAITGRVFVVITTKDEHEPRLTTDGWGMGGRYLGQI